MMRYVKPVTIIGLVSAMTFIGSTSAPPSAQEFYARAVEQMQHHTAPAFATYDATIRGLNCRITALGGMECTLGRSTTASETPYKVDLRESDGRIAINPQDKPVVLGDSTFVNPTWPGVDTLIRHGFTGMGSAAPSTPAPIQRPSALPVIATVSTLSVEDYDVYDAGTAICATGNSGHAVHLVARHDPLRYPLTGATIDIKTGDLCALRFNARVNVAGGVAGFTGGAQLDIESVDGYDIVSNERFGIDLRAIGISVKHLDIDIVFSNFAFPKAIPPDVFATPQARYTGNVSTADRLR
jgi:hypothetical protein